MNFKRIFFTSFWLFTFFFLVTLFWVITTIPSLLGDEKLITIVGVFLIIILEFLIVIFNHKIYVSKKLLNEPFNYSIEEVSKKFKHSIIKTKRQTFGLIRAHFDFFKTLKNPSDDEIKTALTSEGSNIKYVLNQTKEYQLISFNSDESNIKYINNPIFDIIKILLDSGDDFYIREINSFKHLSKDELLYIYKMYFNINDKFKLQSMNNSTQKDLAQKIKLDLKETIY